MLCGINHFTRSISSCISACCSYLFFSKAFPDSSGNMIFPSFESNSTLFLGHSWCCIKLIFIYLTLFYKTIIFLESKPSPVQQVFSEWSVILDPWTSISFHRAKHGAMALVSKHADCQNHLQNDFFSFFFKQIQIFGQYFLFFALSSSGAGHGNLCFKLYQMVLITSR